MASRVLTFARIRPALDREVDEHRLLNRCVAKQPDQSILHVATKPGAPVVIEADGSTSNADVRSFEFDGCFTESCHTSTVYESVGRSFVDCVLSGVNATLMCYGMTGSGKTHTMLGEKGSAVRPRVQTLQLQPMPEEEPISFSAPQWMAPGVRRSGLKGLCRIGFARATV